MAIRMTVKVDDFHREVLVGIASAVEKAVASAIPAIRGRVQSICTSLIEGTDEYRSLLSGELLGELGIPDVRERLHEILKVIRDGIQVKAKPTVIANESVSSGLAIGMIRSDFGDILNLPASSYISNGKYNIQWLRWLILEGDRIVVFDYEVTYALNAAQKARSRTGMALMKPGAGWRVPPQYSGVPDDNFITRSFDVGGVEDLLLKIVEDEIKRNL